MTNSHWFQVNDLNITYEMIDNEVIIVNLKKGHYYSLRGIGAEIWAKIVMGTPENEIASNISKKYKKVGNEIVNSVDNLIFELQEEDIIVPGAGERKEYENVSEKTHQSIAETKRQKFVPPVLEKYTDLEELLLLDPIHEVDESGWPQKIQE